MVGGSSGQRQMLAVHLHGLQLKLIGRQEDGCWYQRKLLNKDVFLILRTIVFLRSSRVAQGRAHTTRFGPFTH